MRGASSQCAVRPLAMLEHGESAVVLMVVTVRTEAAGEMLAEDSKVGVALLGSE